MPGQPVEKAATELVSKVFDRAGDGVLSVLGDVFGGLVGDPVFEWRNRNRVKLAERTAKYVVRKTGSLENLNHLPKGDLYSIFEEASKYDEDELQSIWAMLLATSLTDSEFVGRLRPLIAIARQLDAFDAQVLKIVFEYERTFEKHNAGLEEILSQERKRQVFANEEYMMRFREREKVAMREVDQKVAEFEETGADDNAVRELRDRLEREMHQRIDPDRFSFERMQTDRLRDLIAIEKKEAGLRADAEVKAIVERYHDTEGRYEETSLHTLIRLACLRESSAAEFHPGAETQYARYAASAHLSELERLNEAKPVFGRLFAKYRDTYRTNFVLTNLGYRFAEATCEAE